MTRPQLNPATSEADSAGRLLRKPVIGIAGCCARAASGHAAAAPPSAASKSRRPMVTVIRPSRARCVNETIPRHQNKIAIGDNDLINVCFGPLCGFSPRSEKVPARSFQTKRIALLRYRHIVGFFGGVRAKKVAQ